MKLLVTQMQEIMSGTDLKEKFRASVLDMLSLRWLELLRIGYTNIEFMCEAWASDRNLVLPAYIWYLK